MMVLLRTQQPAALTVSGGARRSTIANIATLKSRVNAKSARKVTVDRTKDPENALVSPAVLFYRPNFYQVIFK